MEGKILIRRSESIYRAQGSFEKGTFQGRWHFSFDQYRDPSMKKGSNPAISAKHSEDPGRKFPRKFLANFLDTPGPSKYIYSIP